jgi:hypothetical protein
MTASFTLLTTTINVPHLLEAYLADAARFERRIDQCIVVGDHKTPPETADLCRQLTRRFAVECRYLGVEEQQRELAPWPDFAAYLPWNCPERRNVGLILAQRNRSDIVVTIDDDNLVEEEDYFGGHMILGDARPVTAVTTRSGWWNPCDMLEEQRGIRFYPRGFPLTLRWRDEEREEQRTRLTGRVAINGGLWLDDPDIDAITRLTAPIRATAQKASEPRHLACGIGTWTPFNAQNTAMLREVVPAYFLFPHIGRYEDIWASYVVKRIADHLGDLITFGAPLVRQERNVHNLLKDLDAERLGMEHTETFCAILKAIPLRAADYRGAFAEIADAFAPAARELARDPAVFVEVERGLRLWAELFASL